ncbi:MAG: putative toxin-antitoxin system toxin component, PIN family [Clostridia bacterium]|nr:putative toxin-antitoxin system toxin component, PIN family [Clostridia bacterium]
MDNIRVVVDTNVFINGIFKQDEYSRALFQLKSANKICFVMNKEMQNELLITFSNILLEAYKRRNKNGEEIGIIPLSLSLSRCLWQVREVDHLIHTNFCEEDKSDNKFIDCCIDDDVKYLITQDQHINNVASQIKEQHNIEVLSPFQFYMKYKMKQL